MLVGLVLAAAFLYTLPNFFGESPAVQVSSARATVKLDAALMSRVEAALKQAGVPYTAAALDPTGMRVRFEDTDTQLKAKDLIHATLNPGAAPQATPEEDAKVNYVVALNLVPASPRWLTAIHALPMYLGLDLRGGVHFLLQVDMQAAITKRIESLTADVRQQLRDKNIRHGGVTREGQTLRVRFRDAQLRARARDALAANLPDLALIERDDGQEALLVGLGLPARDRLLLLLVRREPVEIDHQRHRRGAGMAGRRIDVVGAQLRIVRQGAQVVARREGGERARRREENGREGGAEGERAPPRRARASERRRAGLGHALHPVSREHRH